MLLKLDLSLVLVTNIKRAPTEGNNIKEDKIENSFMRQLNKLVTQKSQEA